MQPERRWIIGIGAMKAGTTTLHDDLATATTAHMLPKESGLFHNSSAQISKEIDRISPAQSTVVEVCASYSMSPEIECPAEQVYEAIGPGAARIIYVVRHPVERMLSQLRHDYARGIVQGDPDQIVRSNERLFNLSLYSKQIEPWKQRFPNQVMVVRFEDYIADRHGQIEEILRFCDVPTATAFHGDQISDQGKNRDQPERVAGGLMSRIVSLPFIRQLRHGALGPIEAPLRRLLLQKPSDLPNQPQQAAIDQYTQRILRSKDLLATSYLD